MKHISKVKIKITPNGDTRTIEKLDKVLVYKDTINHIEAVKHVSFELADLLTRKGIEHDFTKIGKYYDGFFEAISSGKVGDEFYKLEWWDIHRTKERHHLGKGGFVPDDVNLLDVLEMVIDITVAGLARSGVVWDVKLDNEVLQKAYKNTVELIKGFVEVVQDDE